MIATSIPSPPPEWGQFDIGPLTIHAYAIFILIGIFVAVWLTTKRWIERGGKREIVGDVAVWAIPFGIIGGRLYHVFSSPDAYFGEGGERRGRFRGQYCQRRASNHRREIKQNRYPRPVPDRPRVQHAISHSQR